MGRAPRLPRRTCRRTRSSLGADLVMSSIHKIVGSLTQSAMVHLGHGEPARRGRGRPLRDAARVDQPERAADRVARLGAARGGRGRRGAARGDAARAAPRRARAVREVPGLDVLDERLAGAPGVFAYDPLRLCDRRARNRTQRLRAGAAAARAGRRAHGARRRERDRGGVRDGRGRRRPPASGSWRRCAARWTPLSAAERDRRPEAFAPPPPWGELVMTPREAFLGPQEVVPGGRGGRPRGGGVAGRLPARASRTCCRASG